jgi:hypothetical protein
MIVDKWTEQLQKAAKKKRHAMVVYGLGYEAYGRVEKVDEHYLYLQEAGNDSPTLISIDKIKDVELVKGS